MRTEFLDQVADGTGDRVAGVGQETPGQSRLLCRARLVALAVGGFLLPWCVLLSMVLPATAQAQHWSLAWTGLDAAEALAALATAVLLAHGDRRAALTAAAGAAPAAHRRLVRRLHVRAGPGPRAGGGRGGLRRSAPGRCRLLARPPANRPYPPVTARLNHPQTAAQNTPSGFPSAVNP